MEVVYDKAENYTRSAVSLGPLGILGWCATSGEGDAISIFTSLKAILGPTESENYM